MVEVWFVQDLCREAPGGDEVEVVKTLRVKSACQRVPIKGERVLYGGDEWAVVEVVHDIGQGTVAVHLEERLTSIEADSEGHMKRHGFEEVE